MDAKFADGLRARGKLPATLHADRLSEWPTARALLPAKFAFTQVGDLVILAGRTVRAALAPPYPYGEELVGQFLFALSSPGSRC